MLLLLPTAILAKAVIIPVNVALLTLIAAMVYGVSHNKNDVLQLNINAGRRPAFIFYPCDVLILRGNWYLNKYKVKLFYYIAY